MAHTVRRKEFLVDGHRFAVHLDVGGPWNGMAHVVDAEVLEDVVGPDGVRRQVAQTVITGARWDGKTLVVSVLDVMRDDYKITIEPASEALRSLTGN